MLSRPKHLNARTPPGALNLIGTRNDEGPPGLELACAGGQQPRQIVNAGEAPSNVVPTTMLWGLHNTLRTAEQEREWFVGENVQLETQAASARREAKTMNDNASIAAPLRRNIKQKTETVDAAQVQLVVVGNSRPWQRTRRS